MQLSIKKTALAVGVGLAMSASMAEASHFRGAAMIPTVNASGLLTITTTSFWRKTAVDSITPNVGGVGNAAQVSNTIDTSDSRFDKQVTVSTVQLPGAGSFGITWGSCCRVGGIQNAGWNGTNSSSTSWTMNSTIVWDGTNATAPILFDFNNIQPEVVRGQNYADNLGATSGNGFTLSYDGALNGIPAAPPGYSVNAATGLISIPGANTATYLDNGTGNPGADYAFSGNIYSSDGSQVEFDWLFDAVDQGATNLAPTVNSIIINALVGDLINTGITATDPNTGDNLVLSLLSFLGPGNPSNQTFTPGAPGNPGSGTFIWDSTGFVAGTYIASIRASDGSLTDSGTITINLSNASTGVPEIDAAAGTGALSLLAGMLALAGERRRRRA